MQLGELIGDPLMSAGAANQLELRLRFCHVDTHHGETLCTVFPRVSLPPLPPLLLFSVLVLALALGLVFVWSAPRACLCELADNAMLSKSVLNTVLWSFSKIGYLLSLRMKTNRQQICLP
jgi:hypothetical protein